MLAITGKSHKTPRMWHSINHIALASHKPVLLTQADLTAFLRALLDGTRDQVSWAAAAGLPYNSVTNWLAKTNPVRMSADAFLGLVLAAGAEDRLAEQIREWRRRSGDVRPERPYTLPPTPPMMRTIAERLPPVAPAARIGGGSKRKSARKRAG